MQYLHNRWRESKNLSSYRGLYSNFELNVERNDCIGFALLCYLIGLENSPQSLNQSEVKTKPMVPWSQAFSLAWARVLVWTLSSQWLNIFLGPLVTLVWLLHHSIEKCRKAFTCTYNSLAGKQSWPYLSVKAFYNNGDLAKLPHQEKLFLTVTPSSSNIKFKLHVQMFIGVSIKITAIHLSALITLLNDFLSKDRTLKY